MSRRLHWLLPALLAFALYAVTIPGTYTYDDTFVAQSDARLHDPRRWLDYLREGYFPGGADNLWRPLVSLSYAIEWKLHGDRPWIFHLINVLLHAAATMMVARLAARLVNDRVALIAGLLFAAHPIHVEAVAGIVGRAEEMATIGIVGALLLFINRAMTRWRAVGIVGCFLFAAGCKEQGLLIPLMLLLWSYLHRWWSKPDTDTAEQQQANRLLVAMLTLALAVYITYRNHILPWYWERGFLDQTFNPLVKSVGMDRWLIPLAVLGRYVALLFVPRRLSLDYGMDVFTAKLNWHEPYFFVGCIALLCAIALFLLLWRRRQSVSLFLLLCFASAYFMVSNVILIGTIMGERLMYVASTFFCILIAIALAKLSPRWRGGLLSVILILACVRTVSYAYQWNTRPGLYRYSVAVQPHAAMPYLLLSGETDAATSDALMAQARVEAPDSPQVWGKSAFSKIRQGQLDEAEAFARRSMQLRPGNGDALGALQIINEMRAAAQPTSAPTR